jgi:hypothetical protein
MAVKEYVFVFGFVARFSSCMLPSLWMKNPNPSHAIELIDQNN